MNAESKGAGTIDPNESKRAAADPKPAA